MSETNEEIIKEFKKKIMCSCDEDHNTDHTVSNPETTEEALKEALKKQKAELIEKFEGIVGVVDEEFLSMEDAEDYVGEWAINVDRKRIKQELNLIKK